MFTLKIKTDNSAFRDDTDIENTDTSARAIETARILRKIATLVEADAIGGPCFDANGNKVGQYEFTA